MPRVKRENAEIYYEVRGEGSPVAFAHGAGGNTLIWWQQVTFFARNHKVVVFDHRGFGRSTCEEGYLKARYYADDLKAVLDDAGIDRTALVCQSMGGWTGMHFTMANPNRVSCLVLSGTPGGVTTPKLVEARKADGRQRTIDAIREKMWNEPHWALAPSAFERNPGIAYLYGQISSLNPPRGDIEMGEMGIDPESLRDYSTRTLMIGGEEDRIFPIDALKEISELIPFTEFYKIALVGHSPYFEAADEFNRIVSEFISGR